MEEGSIKEEKWPRESLVGSPENIKALRIAIKRSYGKSTRQTPREMEIFCSLIIIVVHNKFVTKVCSFTVQFFIKKSVCVDTDTVKSIFEDGIFLVA